MADNKQSNSSKVHRTGYGIVRDILSVIGFLMFATGMWNIDQDIGLAVIGGVLCGGMCLIEWKAGKR